MRVHALEPRRRVHLALVLNSIDRARHRAWKAAAKWNLSFSRLAGGVRAAVWVRRNVVRLLEMYGTAGGWKSDVSKPRPL